MFTEEKFIKAVGRISGCLNDVGDHSQQFHTLFLDGNACLFQKEEYGTNTNPRVNNFVLEVDPEESEGQFSIKY